MLSVNNRLIVPHTTQRPPPGTVIQRPNPEALCERTLHYLRQEGDLAELCFQEKSSIKLLGCRLEFELNVL